MERERNTYTVKNLCTANQKGMIIYKFKTDRRTDRQVGTKHDYKVYKGNHPDIPKDVMIYYIEFLGVEWLTSTNYPRDLVKIKYVKRELLLKASLYNKFLSL